MEKWEYKILEFKSSGLLTGQTEILSRIDYEEKTTWTGKEVKKAVEKKVSREEIEILFNELGEDGWELIEILPFIGRTGFGEPETVRVQFIFKRKV